jgi:hypothetical protein
MRNTAVTSKAYQLYCREHRREWIPKLVAKERQELVLRATRSLRTFSQLLHVLDVTGEGDPACLRASFVLERLDLQKVPDVDTIPALNAYLLPERYPMLEIALACFDDRIHVIRVDDATTRRSEQRLLCHSRAFEECAVVEDRIAGNVGNPDELRALFHDASIGPTKSLATPHHLGHVERHAHDAPR